MPLLQSGRTLQKYKQNLLEAKKPHSFILNFSFSDDCINCFCFGITDACSSTELRMDQISVRPSDLSVVIVDDDNRNGQVTKGFISFFTPLLIIFIVRRC